MNLKKELYKLKISYILAAFLKAMREDIVVRTIMAFSAVIFIFVTNVAQAGLHKTTVHSRANCANNESITWWNGHAYPWRVVSIHKHVPTKQVHMIDTGFLTMDRVAAVHWGEGVHGGFVVWGYHYLLPDYKSMPFDSTYAEGCNIIEGWY